MLKLKYINSEKEYEIKFSKISAHVVQILGTFPILQDGFFISRNKNDDLWDYTAYTTVYKQIEGGVQFSNDGSVYVEPEPTPEPEPYIPTLEEVKALKLSELSTICHQIITCGVDVDIDGTMEHFSYGIDNGDQGNIDRLFNTATSTGLAQSYHSTGGNCKLYSVEQIISIYFAENMNVAHHTTYFNQLQGYVNSLNDKELVENVSYGQELTGVYLDTYNAMMEHEQFVAKTLLKKAGVEICDKQKDVTVDTK